MFVQQDLTKSMEFVANVWSVLFIILHYLSAKMFANLMKFIMEQIVFVQLVSTESTEYAVSVQLELSTTKILNFVSISVKSMKYSMELHVFVPQDSSS